MKLFILSNIVRLDEFAIKVWTVLLVFVGIYIVYGAAKLITLKQAEKKYSPIIQEKELALSFLNHEISEQNNYIKTLNLEVSNLTERGVQLIQTNNNLEGRIAGLNTQRELRYPFDVPTKGIVGSFAGTFGGNMYGMRHLGIDVWTTIENNGRTENNSGNPVYAACSGVVDNSDRLNGAITIKCDPIPSNYNVPDHNVDTYYAHMGNGVSKNLYIQATPGRRVQKGQLIGYQGNISKFFPNMRNVHLHFSVFGGLSEVDSKKGAYNPCLYIGGDCRTRGARFVTKYD
ncbi:peptidoglycan DD-metalloendopeptidase family protein [Candidatus Dojkabacteria bacterium]|nr:peptidoglycan DD-metalloendopeptidase family protein [Candidatus Dojkabacteria bacterium]